MEYFQYKYETLLGRLGEENYDKLISLQKLKVQGYKYHYIIDPDIILNYCFPYGIDPDDNRIENKKLTESYLDDEQVTLHSFFNINSETSYLTIFNEYLPEIKGMLFKAKEVSDSGKSFGNYNIENIHAAERFNSEKREKFEDRLMREFSYKVADVLFRKNGITKLIDLFKEKKILYQGSDLNDIFLQDAVDFTFFDVKNTSYILSIFSKSIGNDDYFHDREAAKERDSRAIERTISLNRYIQLNGNERQKKNIFLIIADGEINDKIFRELKTSQIIDYPVIMGEKLFFNISVSEYFAYLINSVVHNNNEDNNLQTLSNLNNIRNAYLKLLNELYGENPTNRQKKEFPLKMQKLLNDYPGIFADYVNIRNAIENIGLLQSYDKIHKSIKADIESMKLFELNNFFNQIKKEKILIENLISERSKMLDDLIEEADISFYFIKGVEKLKITNSFYFLKGKDIIESTYQHLPYLLKLSIFSVSLQNRILRLLEICFKKDEFPNNDLYGFFINFFSQFKNTQSQPQYSIQEKVVKAFLLLILPQENNYVTEQKNEKLYKWLSEIDGKLNTKSLFKSEILYLLCWQARRLGNYENALSHASEGIQKFKTDPRFFHGMFLIEYNLYSQNDTKRNKHLHQMIDYLNNACVLYDSFIKENYPIEDARYLLQKFDDVLNNDFCYLYTELGFINLIRNKAESIEFLKIARDYITKIQKDKKFNDELSEYYETLSHLHFIESFAFEDERKYKLEEALEAIEKAIELVQVSDIELSDKYRKSKKLITKQLLEL